MGVMLNKEITTKGITQFKETIHTSWSLIKIVWKTDPLLFIGGLITYLLPAITPFINIYIYKLAIDLVVQMVNAGVFDPTRFYPLLGLRILSSFLQDFTFGAQDYLDKLLWSKVPIELNQMVYRKISSLDIYYFENDKFRDLIEKARESLTFKPQRQTEGLFLAMQSFVQFAIALVTLAHLNLFFVILITAVSIPQFINETFMAKFSWVIWSDNSPFRKRFSHLNHLLLHHREVKEIKIFSLAERFLKEAREIQHKFYLDNKKVATKSFYSSTIFSTLSALVFIGIEVFVIFEAIAKRLTIGDVSFYSGVVTNFQNGLGGVFRNMNMVYDSSLYVKNLFDVLEIEPVIKIAEHPIKLTSKNTPRIVFKNVAFAYPDTTKNILKDFSLVIEPGEKIAFVGENGAGKSTIIKLLLRFYDVTEGEVLVDGINIKELDQDSLYQKIGVLFQDFNKYDDTVKDNIYYGNIENNQDLGEIIKASVSAGSHKMVEGFDKKYEQMLGKMFEGGIEPSGGQWQKIALARAFFRNAPILVLDEPTASIDARAESEIFNRVEKLSRDKTVIIISHRFSTVRNADRIFVIDNGKVVESGSHKDLIKLDGQYAELFNLQAKGYQ